MGLVVCHERVKSEERVGLQEVDDTDCREQEHQKGK